MSKCMYQECNNEATTTIPCFIGPKKTRECIHVCNYHWFLLTKPQPFTVSVKLKKEEIDCLSNLEEQVKERDLYLEREKVLNLNE